MLVQAYHGPQDGIGKGAHEDRLHSQFLGTTEHLRNFPKPKKSIESPMRPKVVKSDMDGALR